MSTLLDTLIEGGSGSAWPLGGEAEALEFETSKKKSRIKIRRLKQRGLPILDQPKEGAFYQIQPGKGGLLTTAGRAYGVGSGSQRLRFAQRISLHPLNRALLVPPKNSFERKFFPGGLVSFMKRFSCKYPQRPAASGQKRCYGVIWIPPRTGGNPFQDLVLMQAPASAKTPLQVAQTLLSNLGATSMCRRLSLNLMVGADDRERVKQKNRTRAPFRWTCTIFAIFPPDGAGNRRIGHGTGVLLTSKRMATAGHVLFGSKGAPDALLVIPGFSKDEPPDVTALDSDAVPFGAFLVSRTDSSGGSNFHVSPEFHGNGEPSADYGVVDLNGARRVGGFTGTPPDGWLTVSRRLALSAPQAANPKGENAPVSRDPAPTRRLIRRLGAKSLKTTGYPTDRLCEMMLSEDRVRLIEDLIRLSTDGTPRKGDLYPDKLKHAMIGSRLDVAFGNSGGPVWVERLVRRREGRRFVNRRQFILSGLIRGGNFQLNERIDFRKSTRTRVVKALPPANSDLRNHTSSEVMVITPQVIDRLMNLSSMVAL